MRGHRRAGGEDRPTGAQPEPQGEPAWLTVFRGNPEAVWRPAGDRRAGAPEPRELPCEKRCREGRARLGLSLLRRDHVSPRLGGGARRHVTIVGGDVGGAARRAAGGRRRAAAGKGRSAGRTCFCALAGKIKLEEGEGEKQEGVSRRGASKRKENCTCRRVRSLGGQSQGSAVCNARVKFGCFRFSQHGLVGI